MLSDVVVIPLPLFRLAASAILFLVTAPVYAQWDLDNPNPECSSRNDKEAVAFCAAVTSCDPEKCARIVDEQYRLYCRGSSGDKDACGRVTNSEMRGYCWKRLNGL
jgi:hypothetical protein